MQELWFNCETPGKEMEDRMKWREEEIKIKSEQTEEQKLKELCFQGERAVR